MLHRRYRRTRVTKSQPASRRRLTHLICALVLGSFAGPALLPAAPALAANKLGDRSLRMGDKGKDVKELQQLLVQVGIKTTVDGTFGAGTKKAVQRFQGIAMLDKSGTVGPKTIDALRRSAAGGSKAQYDGGGFSTTSGSTKSLGDRIPVRPGMSGHDIKVLQDFLNRAGFKVSVDGEFGKGTTTAVKKFEKANKLPQDGVVDAPDIEVLRGQASAGSDATAAAQPLKLGPGDRATVGPDGLAIAPASAPDAVKQIIAAGNKIAKTPYIYGGGHGKWEDKGYDCSGSVSYALHGADLLDAPLVSGDFPSWGEKGPGQWVTIYGNAGHVYMVVAGLRFDTSGAKEDGSRWHKSSRPTKGYGVSHPVGL
ncbi:endolysin [Paraconexibacter sp. AEG42_29]|uniref:Endolysin n=1 Tax=Paraconexibacter sp. AEG42_29 TaxID=2997339 RepID=A0AAU7B010_9ACTN